MAFFKYKAKNNNDKEVVGTVEAFNQSAAMEILQDRGLKPISISEESKGEGMGIFSILDRVTEKELVVFSRQFAVLMSANVTMVQSLKILTDQATNVKLKMIISSIADEVDSGSRLSDALAKWSNYFSDFFISVIKSGETSGKLDEVLNYLADEMEKDYDMMSKIKGAMIYPAFVISGLLVVGIVVVVFVLPKLTDILQNSNAELPFATRMLIATSNGLIHYWWMIIILAAAIFFGAKIVLRTEQGKMVFGSIKLHLPVFGKLFQKIYLVRFTRSMYTLLVGGVTIVDSLKIAADVVSNATYKNLIIRTAKEVEDGNSINSVFSESSVIPRMVSQMISVGEKTGRLDVILARISDFYGREIDNTVANLMTLMEPIIMVIMGVGVGMMVSAIILPMYNMASQM